MQIRRLYSVIVHVGEVAAGVGVIIAVLVTAGGVGDSWHWGLRALFAVGVALVAMGLVRAALPEAQTIYRWATRSAPWSEQGTPVVAPAEPASIVECSPVPATEAREPDRESQVFRIRKLLRAQRDEGREGLKWDDGFRSGWEIADEMSPWVNHTSDLLQDAYGLDASTAFRQSLGKGRARERYAPMVDHVSGIIDCADQMTLLPEFRFEHWEPQPPPA